MPHRTVCTMYQRTSETRMGVIFMILFLFSIAISCLLIALAQGAVFLISLVAKSAHRAKSTSVRRSVQNFTGLPNREEVKNIYSLSDQFADRLREVVQS